MAHLLAGSDVRYDTGLDHPLAGRLVPDLILRDGRRVAELLHQGRPVVLDLSDAGVAEAARGWTDRVDIVAGSSADIEACGLILRPDGYVAWAADTFDADDEKRLHVALHRWFGVSASARGEMRRGGELSSAPAEERTA
jgi:hypothetical protein